MQTRKIPATIVTGFLGSGKTTLLRHILENANGRRIAVIVNEFGELGIDGEILKGCGIGCDESGQSNGQLYELANGCLCCTVQEEFFPVMEQLLERRGDIDHVLIETSGLALPKPLVQAFNWPSIKNAFTVDAVVTVVDGAAAAAGQFAADPDAVDAQRKADPNLDHESPLHALFEDQLGAADLVIVNKTDLMDDAQRADVEALIRPEIPAEVKIVGAQGGKLDIELLLGLNRASEDTIHLRPDHHGSADDPGHADHHHDEFDSVVVELGEVDRDQLIDGLRRLVESHTIYRIKGFAKLPAKPMRLVLHGVGRRFDSYFDRRWLPGEAQSTRIVLIGQALDQPTLQAALEAALPAAAVRTA
ncbi:cobalamin biosynthesis protein CobW [Cupriavidus basilensis]|uniref:cobalamin biosynthesis protein CobW n=1 Tax=Cupriavidus basilensis TaxID=68895 RepID=UPI00157B2206|nr:cobalamin biosynthesis protein CobW [Cupriavidus basilensis]NUA31467.1 cobalamin biosynthesis protein CobW [Cupriavidus basilensis]